MWRRRLVSADSTPSAIELSKQRLRDLVQQKRRGEAAVDMIHDDIMEKEELVREYRGAFLHLFRFNCILNGLSGIGGGT